MKDTSDSTTIDLFSDKKRGRPKTDKALSNAERQRRYRQQQKSRQPAIPDDAAAQIKALTSALELEWLKVSQGNNRINELLAVIKTHETTNKALSTKLSNVTQKLKTTERELDRARAEVFKHDRKWI